MNAIQGLPAKATVANSETWQKHKKFTVYKVLVTCQGRTWTYFRRYNEFHKLYEVLKKQFPGICLKLPRKKLFGNNFDPLFVRSRREGLNNFVQKLVSNQQLFQHPHVRDFLGLASATSTEETGTTTADDTSDGTSEDVVIDKPMDLGPSEKPHAKPSDFEFLKVIGKGSFGKVLLAKHKSDGRIYAVKVLQKKVVKRRKSNIMVERNVLLKNLDHPFLVGLHFSFQTSQKLYFVLDYANGGELFFHLQQERHFSEPRARFYAAEMASAIGYLHQQGIVYRDLKPENILLDSDGHIVLTDFGLCKENIRESDTTSTFCGTPEYLAPEVLRKEPYDRSVDWWCLGVVLYEMIYGLPPFYSRDTADMYDNILNKPLRLKTANVSLAGRNIMEALLHKDKERRLGAGSRDFEDVKSHEFFSSINWDNLVAKRIDPPYHPNLSGQLDLKNIDPEFTKEPVPASVGQSMHSVCASIQETDTCHFDGFSYMANVDHLTDT